MRWILYHLCCVTWVQHMNLARFLYWRLCSEELTIWRLWIIVNLYKEHTGLVLGVVPPCAELEGMTELVCLLRGCPLGIPLGQEAWCQQDCYLPQPLIHFSGNLKVVLSWNGLLWPLLQGTIGSPFLWHSQNYVQRPQSTLSTVAATPQKLSLTDHYLNFPMTKIYWALCAGCVCLPSWRRQVVRAGINNDKWCCVWAVCLQSL